MSAAIRSLQIRLKNAVLDLSYAYGYFVADHSLYIILVCFGIFLLSLFQITTNVPPPGSTLEFFAESARSFRPVRARLELNTSDQLHDKQPDKPLWYSGYPLAYVQHLVIRCSRSTSRSSCFHRAREIHERLLADSQYELNCLRVGEPKPAEQLQFYLPSYSCLFLSPFNLWANDVTRLSVESEEELLERISSLSKRYPDIVFGIPQEYFPSAKPLTYAITLLLSNASSDYRQQLKRRLLALEDQQLPPSNDEIIHIYFSRKSLLYYLPLLLIYIVVFLYIYYSVCQFECVKSKWGLAFAATVQIVVSLLISLALSSFFHMTLRLDGGEVFPYLVIFIGLENLVVLTRAVTSSQAQKQHDDVRERVAHALRAESWTISKHLVYELSIVLIGYLTYVPTVQEFCQLALIGILLDFFMQINFWLAVLSIDVRRFNVGRGRKKSRQPFEQEKAEMRRALPMKMPAPGSKRVQQSQWAKSRVLQRGTMVVVLVWVILIFYKSCLIVDLLHQNVQINREQIKDLVPEKMLKEHFAPSHAELSEESTAQNHSLPKYNWQTLLAYDHWPTLFSFYNISYDNRYLTIMPSIYLPVYRANEPRDASARAATDRPLLDEISPSPHSSLIDVRFSSAVWELLLIVVLGLVLFGFLYLYFASSFPSSRAFACTKLDYSVVPTLLLPPSSTALVESFCLHESGTVLTLAYSDGSIAMWQPQTGQLLCRQQRHASNHVWCSLMLEEQRCLLGCSDGQLEIYPAAKKNAMFSGNEHGGVTQLLRASSTMIVGGTRRGYVIALEYLHGAIREIYRKRIHQWPIRVCQIESNSSLIFTGSDDHSIKVTSLLNGMPLHTLQKHQSPVNCLAIDPYHPSTVVSGCFSGCLCVWNGNELAQAHLHAHPHSFVSDVSFCGHSSTILSLGSDKRLCIWTYATLHLLHELPEISSNSLSIHRANYLFYSQANHLYISDTLHASKISTKEWRLPFFHAPLRDEEATNVEKLLYLSPSETLILQNADVLYAMHLPQRLFLRR